MIFITAAAAQTESEFVVVAAAARIVSWQQELRRRVCVSCFCSHFVLSHARKQANVSHGCIRIGSNDYYFH